MGQRAAQGVARGRRLDEEIERVEPEVDRGRVGQRTGQPLGEQAGPGGGHGQVERRQERAFTCAVQGSRELEVGAGGGINFEARPARAPRRKRESRPGLDLSALDIGQRQGGGGDLGARERAETVEGLDAVEFTNSTFCGRAIAPLARERRRRQPHVGDDPGEQPLIENRLRSDKLAWLETRDLRGEARLVRLRERECAGRKIERRKTVNVPRVARSDLLDGDEQARTAGL